MTTTARSPEELLREAAAGAAYPADAYRFLYESLDLTGRRLGRKGHVTGRELLEGIRDLALHRFGGLALMVFHAWNVRSTRDWGEMVFRLVNAGLMGRTEEDSIADFDDVYSFEEAFRFDAEIPDLAELERE